MYIYIHICTYTYIYIYIHIYVYIHIIAFSTTCERVWDWVGHGVTGGVWDIYGVWPPWGIRQSVSWPISLSIYISIYLSISLNNPTVYLSLSPCLARGHNTGRRLHWSLPTGRKTKSGKSLREGSRRKVRLLAGNVCEHGDLKSYVCKMVCEM